MLLLSSLALTHSRTLAYCSTSLICRARRPSFASPVRAARRRADLQQELRADRCSRKHRLTLLSEKRAEQHGIVNSRLVEAVEESIGIIILRERLRVSQVA